MNQNFRKRSYLRTVLAIVFFAGILVVVSIAIFHKSPSTPKITQYAQMQVPGNEDFDDADFERDGKWYGLCNKNSIHSVDDFRKTVFDDTALKTHYAGFNWEKAQMGSLQSPMFAYVYYRKDGKIFRKGKPIKLPAGDGYITDGTTTVRTYCCNNYTEAPPDQDAAASATAPLQPTPSSLPPTEKDSSGSFTGTGLFAMVGGWIKGSDSKPRYYTGGHDSPIRVHPLKPTPVPEPGTGTLVAIGVATLLVIFAIVRLFRRVGHESAKNG